MPVQVAALTVAAAGGGASVKPGTLRELTVEGKPAFAIQAGADLATDAVPFPTSALDPVTITMHLAEPSGPATYHAQALATTHRAAGDHHADADGTAFTETSQSWYYLDAVIDVAAAMGEALDAAHDSGDQLHPNDAGYRAMANAVDVTLL